MPNVTISLIPIIRKFYPEFLELKINLFNNLMLALLKNQEFDQVISTGKLVIIADPQNVKGLFRMGQAYYSKKN